MIMRKLTLSIAALAAALTAGVASAQSVNPGVAQLAASVGVSATAFTPAQMIRLEQAQRENDQQTIDFILSQANGAVSRSDKGASVSAGDVQLARIAGVEPGLYSTAELSRLIDAQRNDRSDEVNFILSGENRTAAADASVVTPGEAQIAAFLGVNPAEYTLAELTALAAERSDD
jgi:hypothetical protein